MTADDALPPSVNPGQADISIAVGPDANLSPAVRRALEDLAEAMEQSQPQQIRPELGCTRLSPCTIYASCGEVI